MAVSVSIPLRPLRSRHQAYLWRGCVVSWGPAVLIPPQEIAKDCRRASLCTCVCLRERDRETERDVADRVSYWFPSRSVSVDLMGDLKRSGQCVHLRISICAGVLNSANHGYVEHIFIYFSCCFFTFLEAIFSMLCYVFSAVLMVWLGSCTITVWLG